MTNKEQYYRLKQIQDYNKSEARNRIIKRFGGFPPNCEDNSGKPICKFYSVCKQVKTYECGAIIEPLCALPDEEVVEFVIPVNYKTKNRLK